MTAATVGKLMWMLGVAAWSVIRYPFERRAKRVGVVSDGCTLSEAVGLACAFLGLAIVPGVYVATGAPGWADFPASRWAVAFGALVFLFALWVFRRSHKDLGRNWSISLQIRERHTLVRTGVYALIRHPMYTSFLLMGLGQAFLLANWVAALSGLVGFGVLFFLRVDKEERMMLDTFGPEYRSYMEETKRIIPYLY